MKYHLEEYLWERYEPYAKALSGAFRKPTNRADGLKQTGELRETPMPATGTVR